MTVRPLRVRADARSSARSPLGGASGSPPSILPLSLTVARRAGGRAGGDAGAFAFPLAFVTAAAALGAAFGFELGFAGDDTLLGLLGDAPVTLPPEAAVVIVAHLGQRTSYLLVLTLQPAARTQGRWYTRRHELLWQPTVAPARMVLPSSFPHRPNRDH